MQKRTSIIVTFSLLLYLGIPILTFPLLVKAFDISSYGIWIEANTIVSLLVTLSAQGLANALGAMIVKENTDQQVIYANTLYSVLLIGSILTFALYLSAPVVSSVTIRDPRGLQILQILAIDILLFALNILTFQVYRLQNRPLTGAVFDIIVVAVRLGSVFFALMSKDLIAFALVHVGAHSIATVFQVTVAFARVKFTRPSWTMMLKLFGYGLNLSMVSQANWVVMYGDRLMLSFLATSAAVAVYAASYQLTSILVALGWPHLYTLLPTLGEHWKAGNVIAIHMSVRQSTRMIFITVIPGIFGLALIGNDLLKLLANSDFAQGGVLIGMIAIGISLDIIGTSLQYIFYTQDRVQTLRNIYGRAMILNILANLIAIPLFSYSGAGLTTMLTFFYIFYSLWRNTKMPFKILFDINVIWRCLIAGAVMGAWVIVVVEASVIRLAVAIGGGAIIYGAGIIFLNVISLNEVLSIPRAIIRRATTAS
ncbi:MAG: oligosaccharide flippase family protein [Anaerolineae bacterium]